MQRFRIENDLRNRVFFSGTKNIPTVRYVILIENPDLLTETKNRTSASRFVNGGHICLSGGLAIFWRRTLEPIKNMIDTKPLRQRRFP
jgi:hypothetical protein